MDKHPKKELDFNYIDEGIYIGTNKCCQTHFDEGLKKEGVSADISLEKEQLDAPFGVEFYAWIPVKDDTAPGKDQLEFGVSVIQSLVAMKKKIYVHCHLGHGRAPTLVAAYFIKKGYSVDEAIALIKSKRPSVHINDAQKKALMNFAKNR